MIKLIEYTNNQKSPSDDILEFINLINEKYNINDYLSMMTYQPQPVLQSITRVVEEPIISQEESISVEEPPKDESTEEPLEVIKGPTLNFDGKYYTYGLAGKYRDLGTNGRQFYLRYEFKSPVPIDYTYNGKKLITMDILQLFKLEGLTKINNKKIRLNKDRKNPRTWGKNKASYHRVIDKDTGLVAAWDVSIVNGTLKDYDDLAKAMIENKNIYSWLALKGFGIFDEVRGTSTDKTGPHFHIGPDKGALRDFYGFIKKFAPHYLRKGGIVLWQQPMYNEQEPLIKKRFK